MRELRTGSADYLCPFLVAVAIQLGAACVSTATPAINVDLHRGDPDPANAGTPSDNYGDASGRAGTWNGITILDFGPHSLVDVNGDASGASLTISTAPPSGGRVANNSSTFGDDEALLDDGHGIPDGLGPFVAFTVSGLTPGTYQVYTYAWDPSVPSYRSATVDVNGVGAVLVAPTSNLFGGFVLGETHAIHSVTIAVSEDIVITAMNVDDIYDQTTVNGFQILPEGPEATEGATWGAIKVLYR